MLDGKDFIWAVGIEDTFVTQTAKGERPLDEYELTQHYSNWKEDLDLARDSGAEMIRYGIPWYKVEPEEGQFDWSWIDKVMDYFKARPNFIPIIDLMHYGTPHWLENEFMNEKYPEHVANYGKAFAERYKDHVKYFTPLNEPYVNAEFCGLNGTWPPYLLGFEGFYKMMVQLGAGIIKTVEAVQSVHPEARFVHVDATKRYMTNHSELQKETNLWNENRFVSWELITGNISTEHPLFEMMRNYGISSNTLLWFMENRIELDIVGLNYYPQFSVHEVKRDESGHIRYPHLMGTEEDMAEIIKEAYKRYQRPIMITETSFNGSEKERVDWLRRCHFKCQSLRKQLPLVGLTWFPFFDLVDWGYRTSGKTAAEELLPFGLYTLTEDEKGNFVREGNAVLDVFKAFAKQHKEVENTN